MDDVDSVNITLYDPWVSDNQKSASQLGHKLIQASKLNVDGHGHPPTFRTRQYMNKLVFLWQIMGLVVEFT